MDNLKPNHYKFSVNDKDYEVRDLIDSANLSYHVGTAVAYICRAGKKDKSTFNEDISKARKSLKWEPKWSLEEALDLIVEWQKCWLNNGDIKMMSQRQINSYMND